jgi:sialic acid synthase SpsE
MLFIAEIGMNHNGNFDLAFELIKQAKLAGADIAKFQLGWRDGDGEINQIDLDILKKLNKWCDYFEIEFLASTITEKAFELAKKINPKRYKIASRTVKDNIDLVRKVVNEGKETIISLGMWNYKEPPIQKNDNIKYLWCKSKYPAEPWDLIDLPNDFKDSLYDGYSDHTVGIETSLIAIARGAKIIEKHFTLDKSDTTIRDHALSSTPDEFKMMVNIGRDIARKIQIGV